MSKNPTKAYCTRRANKAARMLKIYDPYDLETSIADCIADLMHLCHSRNYDITHLFDKGRMHFNAELIGGEHG